MAYATANRFRILVGRIDMMQSGAWTAELEVDTAEAAPVTGAITIAIGESFTLKGFAVTSAIVGERASLRVVGGAGGMSKPLEAKGYKALPARIPIVEALDAGGERLSPASDASVLDAQLANWARTRGTVGDALTAILRQLEADWRIEPDGTVWVGHQTWLETKVKGARLLDEDPKAGRVCFEITGNPLLPGTTYQGRRLTRVILKLEADAVHCEAWRERQGAPKGFGDSFLSAVRVLVERFTKHVDYYAVRTAKVVTQRGDGSLDIKPDDDRFPALTQVPIHWGLPGCKAKILPGTRVLFTFDGGDSTKPFILSGFEFGAVQELLLGGEDGRPAARVGDSVTLTMPAPIPITGMVTDTKQPITGTLTVESTWVGMIITGSGRVKISA